MENKDIKIALIVGPILCLTVILNMFGMIYIINSRDMSFGLYLTLLLYLSSVGFGVAGNYYGNKKFTYFFATLAGFGLLSCSGPTFFFILFIIKPDFKIEHIPPRFSGRDLYDYQNFNIFSLFAVFIAVFIFILLLASAVLIGRIISKKISYF